MFSFIRVPDCILALLVDPTGYWAPTIVLHDATERIAEERWTTSTPRRQSMVSSDSSSLLDISLDSILDTPQCQSIQSRVCEADDSLLEDSDPLSLTVNCVEDSTANMDDELDLFKSPTQDSSCPAFSFSASTDSSARFPALKRNFSASTVSSMLKAKELKKSPSIVSPVSRPMWRM